MDRSNDSAQRGDSDASPMPDPSDWADLSPLSQPNHSEGWKRRYLLKLRSAAYERLRTPAPRKRQA